MTTYPHQHELHLHRPHVNPRLVAAVGLAAALIGLSAWALVDRYAGSSSATENATALIDEFNAASSHGDSKAIAALFTGNAVLYQNGDSLAGAKAIGKMIASQPGLDVKRIAPVSVSGKYATTFIHFSSLGGLVRSLQLSAFMLEDGKIARAWGFRIGLTPPFNDLPLSEIIRLGGAR